MSENEERHPVDDLIDEAKQEAIEEKQSEEALGIKTNAGEIPEVEEQDESSQKQAFPAFFVDSDKRLRVEVVVVYNQGTGEVQLIAAGDGKNFENFAKLLTTYKVWAEFTQPTYEDMSQYRSVSMDYEPRYDTHVANPVKMRLQFLRYHLKDWNIVDNEGNKVELEHDDIGGLTQESMDMVLKVSPSIIDILLTRFEKEAALS